MGQPTLKRPIYTRQQYLSLDRMSNVRHEYWCGEIYAMAGGSRTHARLIGQMTTILNNAVSESGCYAAPSDQRVRAEADDLDTYPDVVVLCDDARFDPADANTLIEPRVLVEVLSPSTMDYDRTTKLQAYQRIASVSDCLIVWQDQVRVEHHLREEGWQTRVYRRRDERVRLQGFPVDFELEELYRGLNLPDGMEVV